MDKTMMSNNTEKDILKDTSFRLSNFMQKDDDNFEKVDIDNFQTIDVDPNGNLIFFNYMKIITKRNRIKRIKSSSFNSQKIS